MTELMGPKMPFQNGLPKRVQWWASSKHPQKQVRPPVGDQNGKAEAGEEAAHSAPPMMSSNVRAQPPTK